MKIRFTQRNTLSTSRLRRIKTSNMYYLLATSEGASQAIGYAYVFDDGIEVFTLRETSLGKVKTRNEAKLLIHKFHQRNGENSPFYIGENEELEL